MYVVVDANPQSTARSEPSHGPFVSGCAAESQAERFATVNKKLNRPAGPFCVCHPGWSARVCRESHTPHSVELLYMRSLVNAATFQVYRAAGSFIALCRRRRRIALDGTSGFFA